ncbi:MAG TPA: FtsX-like permease family protein, partial [Dehalococcoidia bacterium]|nr:FtsX-like permease family protein [Dehalococcoidia bacterium]
ADLWVVQPGTSDPFHSASFLEEAKAQEIAAVPGVASVSKVLARQMVLPGSDRRVFLLGLEPPPGLSPVPNHLSRFFPPPGEINIDSVFARKTGLKLGDTVDFGPRVLHVGQVFSGGNAVITQFAFLSPEDARAIFGIPGAVNFLLVTLAPGADRQDLADAIQSSVSGVTVLESEQFVAAVRKEIDESFLPVIGLLVGIGFAVGGAVIGLTIYTATIERSREYGVLKAIGASAAYLYRIVAVQSLLLGVLGFLVGLAASILLAEFAGQAVPEFVTDIRWYDVLGVLAAAILMSILSSYIPARRIARIDPATVFRA